MATDKNFSNAALPHDGCLDLITVNGDVSPLLSIKFIQDVENNRLMDSPLVAYRKISAYRITPRSQAAGAIAVDGEIFPFKPLQGEVHRGLGRVLSKDKVFQASGPPGWEETRDEIIEE